MEATEVKLTLGGRGYVLGGLVLSLDNYNEGRFNREPCLWPRKLQKVFGTGDLNQADI